MVNIPKGWCCEKKAEWKKAKTKEAKAKAQKEAEQYRDYHRCVQLLSGKSSLKYNPKIHNSEIFWINGFPKLVEVD